jgi:P-type conjugative transfer protein TrbJ
MRRRIDRLLAVLIAALLLFPRSASALVVTCTNCGTEFTQLANNVQLVDQLARQVELVQNALLRYENMLLNTKGLDDQLFGDALADLRKVMAALGQARSLSVTSASLDADFRNKFKDYAAYVKDQLGVDGLADKYQQWSEDTNSSVLTSLKAAREQSQQIEGSEATLLQGLEQLATTAEGRMQALQVANQIALAGARQTQKLRQLLTIHLQLQANFIQTQTDREASQGAALNKFVTTGRETVKTGDGKGF